MLNAKVDIRKIQEVLGHANLATTALYAAVDMNAKEGAIDALPFEMPGQLRVIA